MQLLIAHGDDASRLALKLVAAGLPVRDLEVIESAEGMETLGMLLAGSSPGVAIVDWNLPGCDGPELCRLVRAYRGVGRPYIILLAPGGLALAEGLEAGADDCVSTPAGADELRARINVGRRFAALPWERVAGPAIDDTRSSSVHELHSVPQLDAQRSQDDESFADDDASCARFELQSVLVAH
jgi:DNA-binding response OmpR family regulator